MVLKVKSRFLNKGISFLVSLSFLFTNISFAASLEPASNNSEQSMLSPAIKVTSEDFRNMALSSMNTIESASAWGVFSAEQNPPVWFFGRDAQGGLLTKGNKDLKALLGGKGANLAEMSSLSYMLDGKEYPIMVPQGFTGTTTEAQKYFDNGNKLSEEHVAAIKENLAKLEEVSGRKFGGSEKPLLLSVRSGARISMPGMMDTVLNLGLNDQSVEALAREFNNERFAWDSYRRLIMMFSDVVLGLGSEHFEELLAEKRKERGVKNDNELKVEDLKDLVRQYKLYVRKEMKHDFPQDVMEQLLLAYEAVYRSSFTPRVISYRRINKIPDDTLSAVNAQIMVFGNLNNNSGTGVAFTRDPASGEKVFYGEYLINAQGEDVVAGIRTPMPINIAGKELFLQFHPEYAGREHEVVSLEEAMPEAYRQLDAIQQTLEKHYRDMQDIEFTIQDGVLFLLQTRNGKRTAISALNILMDMVDEGMITKEEAIMRLEPEQLDSFLHPLFDKTEKKKAQQRGLVVTKGLNASPGASVGKAVFTWQDAVAWKARGEKVILVRPETTPDDIEGMQAAEAILTSRGGKTSHAAVVARGMGKTAVVGAGDLRINLSEKRATGPEDVEIKEGDVISIDGYTGEIIIGELKTADSIIVRGKNKQPLNEEEQMLFDRFERFFQWVDEYRGGVRANAETAEDLHVAFDWFGADGIGLARTEHMFFKDAELGENRLRTIQKAIISGKIKNIRPLGKFQQDDFLEMFKIVKGKPATIRLLDPPLHEFLPNPEDKDGNRIIDAFAEDAELGMTREEIVSRIEALEEANPMAGLRGDRLLMMYPEFLELQIRAIFGAYEEAREAGIPMSPVEIMIPLVGLVGEFDFFAERINRIAKEFGLERYQNYTIGTMIEVPSAAITADAIGKKADFFSAGTNDLHQFSFKFSRDDAGNIVIPAYTSEATYILRRDPFNTIDEVVGEMLAITNALGKAANPKLKMGLCGEQGGDAESIKETIIPAGLDYTSCSPFRIPGAKLASAQKMISAKRAGKTASVPYDLKQLEPASLAIERVEVNTTDTMMNKNHRRKNLTRSLLLTDTAEKKDAISEQLANAIQDDFKAMLIKDQQAFIRLFDRDLGGLFIPRKILEEEGLTALRFALDMPEEEIKAKIKKLNEFNPAMGNIGVRQMLTGTPEIVRTQIKALSHILRGNRSYQPQIIIPLLIDAQEFNLAKDMIVKMLQEEGIDPSRVKIGAAIETPRAALRAGAIAKVADFVIFDTLGMTESVLATTKADAESFLAEFVARGIYAADPFKVLAMENVGKFIGIAKRRALEANPEIPVYMFGEAQLSAEQLLQESLKEKMIPESAAAGLLGQGISTEAVSVGQEALGSSI